MAGRPRKSRKSRGQPLYSGLPFSPKGADLLTFPIPTGLIKMDAVFLGAEFKTQRPQFGKSQAEAQKMPGSKSETSHYRKQGSS